jgi:hypothetical protein
VSSPELWRWSSFRYYRLGEEGHRCTRTANDHRLSKGLNDENHLSLHLRKVFSLDIAFDRTDPSLRGFQTTFDIGPLVQ